MPCFVSRSDRTVTAAGRRFRASALRHLNSTCSVLGQTREAGDEYDRNVNRVTNTAALRERTERCPEPGCWTTSERPSVDALTVQLQGAQDELRCSEKVLDDLRSRPSRLRLWSDNASKRAVGDVATAHQRVNEWVEAVAEAKRHENQWWSAQARAEARAKAAANARSRVGLKEAARRAPESKRPEDIGAGPYGLFLAGVGRKLTRRRCPSPRWR